MNLKRLATYIILWASASFQCVAQETDSIYSGFQSKLSWRIGAEANPVWIPGTNSFLINVGYRLGNFKDPQNLMLGVGVRL